MGLQKYRADLSEPQNDGSVKWYSNWLGGPSLAKITNCQINGTEKRATVYITGEADTWFSAPACTRLGGRYLGGYVTGDEAGNTVFRVMDKFKDRVI